MRKREVIIADEGKVLTDGKTYGKVIYLAEGKSADSFHEITDAEYNEIMRAEEEAAKQEALK